MQAFSIIYRVFSIRCRLFSIFTSFRWSRQKRA